MKDMTDVCRGNMHLKALTTEIHKYMAIYRPAKMVIEIKLGRGGYHSTIYIPINDFKKK